MKTVADVHGAVLGCQSGFGRICCAHRSLIGVHIEMAGNIRAVGTVCMLLAVLARPTFGLYCDTIAVSC